MCVTMAFKFVCLPIATRADVNFSRTEDDFKGIRLGEKHVKKNNVIPAGKRVLGER